MGIINDLIGDGIAKPIEAVGNLYTTDKARIEAQTAYEQVAQQPGLKQLDNNKTMLMSQKFFESAWQALVGWTSGACVALYYLPQLVVADILWTMNCIEAHEVLPFPIPPDNIIQLVYLLFGFGTYHLVKKKVLG